jgi:hypothetical protein
MTWVLIAGSTWVLVAPAVALVVGRCIRSAAEDIAPAGWTDEVDDFLRARARAQLGQSPT